MRCIVIAVGLLASSRAYAGDCLSEAERETEANKLELVARSPDKVGDDALPALRCVTRGSAYASATTAKAFEQRALAACTAIAARRARGDRIGELIHDCIDFAVAHGVTTSGKIDLVERIMGRPAGPFDDPGFAALATSGDARVRAYIAGKLRDALAKVGARKLAGWRRDAWRRYRLAALAALARVGTADDLALVDKVASATPTRERDVRAAIAAARAALSK